MTTMAATENPRELIYEKNTIMTEIQMLKSALPARENKTADKELKGLDSATY